MGVLLTQFENFLTLSKGIVSREQYVTRATQISEIRNIFEAMILSSSHTGMVWRTVLFSRKSTSKDEVSLGKMSDGFLCEIQNRTIIFRRDVLCCEALHLSCSRLNLHFYDYK